MLQLFFPVPIPVSAEHFLRDGPLVAITARKLRATLALIVAGRADPLATTVLYMHSIGLPAVLALPAILSGPAVEALLVSFLLLFVADGDDDLLLGVGEAVAGLFRLSWLQDRVVLGPNDRTTSRPW